MSEHQYGWLRTRWRRSARPIVAAVATLAGIAALGVGVAIGTSEAAVSLAAPANSRVAAGYAYSCAIKTDGTLWCWGSNGSGQLGDGTTTSRETPAQVGDAADWAGI